MEIAVRHDNFERLLIEHTDAWNNHDLNRLLRLFADDCMFDASADPEAQGRRFEGRDAVRAAFAEVLDSIPDANGAMVGTLSSPTTMAFQNGA